MKYPTLAYYVGWWRLMVGCDILRYVVGECIENLEEVAGLYTEWQYSDGLSRDIGLEGSHFVHFHLNPYHTGKGKIQTSQSLFPP